MIVERQSLTIYNNNLVAKFFNALKHYSAYNKYLYEVLLIPTKFLIKINAYYVLIAAFIN